MGKHKKEDVAPPFAPPATVQSDKTQKISEIRRTMEDVQIIDDSIKKHPIPKPTVE